MAEAALVLIFASALMFALSRQRPRLRAAGRWVLGAAGVLLVALIVYRSVRISFPALTGTYEGMLFTSAVMTLLLLLLERRLFGGDHRIMAAGAGATFVFLAVLVSPVIPSTLMPPVPILRSHWLVLHVAFAFVGLALFTLGAVSGGVGLGVADPANADKVRDDAIAAGFVFYTTGGLVFGAIWAEAAWGRFWGWDPKETWALVTTLTYAAYLHLRYIRKVGQELARWFAIGAWLVAGFTFWGVNSLLPGLHSY